VNAFTNVGMHTRLLNLIVDGESFTLILRASDFVQNAILNVMPLILRLLSMNNTSSFQSQIGHAHVHGHLVHLLMVIPIHEHR
jgi:hypothetical protein